MVARRARTALRCRYRAVNFQKPAGRGSRVAQLLDNVKLDLGDAVSNHPERFSGRVRDIDHASFHEWTTVIHSNRDRPPRGDVGDAHLRTEG